MPGYYRCACQEGYHSTGVDCEPTTLHETTNSTRNLHINNDLIDIQSGDDTISNTLIPRKTLRKRKQGLFKALQRRQTEQNRQRREANFQHRHT